MGTRLSMPVSSLWAKQAPGLLHAHVMFPGPEVSIREDLETHKYHINVTK